MKEKVDYYLQAFCREISKNVNQEILKSKVISLFSSLKHVVLMKMKFVDNPQRKLCEKGVLFNVFVSSTRWFFFFG